MSVQPNYESPLADYLYGIEAVGAENNAKRHAVMSYVSSRDNHINELDPYEYMDIDSGYGFLRASQVDTAAEILNFAKDEKAAASDAGFGVDVTLEDYAYDNGYDEPELMIAEMAHGMHKGVWKPVLPVVEAAKELHDAFGIQSQYVDFDKYPQLNNLLENTNMYDKVPSLAHYYELRGNFDNLANEELVVDVAMTESYLADEHASAGAMFSDTELRCLQVTEEFAKGFTREDRRPAMKAHFEDLYKNALMSDVDLTARDVMHVGEVQSAIRDACPYEIETLTFTEQMSPDIQKNMPHFLFDSLEASQNPSTFDDAKRKEFMNMLSDERNIMVDFDRGIAMMSDTEDQSIRGFVLGKENMIDTLKSIPNNMSTKSAFYGPIADNAQSSFSTWDVGFPMIVDKFAEQGMENMFCGKSPSDLRHELNTMLRAEATLENEDDTRVKATQLDMGSDMSASDDFTRDECV